MPSGELRSKVQETFEKCAATDKSVAISAIQTLLILIDESSATTISELYEQMKQAVEILKSQKDQTLSATSINSGSELFMRFISNIRDERRDNFDECRKLMLSRGNRFVKKVMTSRDKIASLGAPHIKENSTILVHSLSRVVLQLLSSAAECKKQFTVFVTESAPDKSGHKMVNELKKRGIQAKSILDPAVAYYMEKIDLVLVGAEGVLASGGIINKIGTLSIAMIAKTCNKPFYVAAESFKFSNLYPLSQSDLTRLSLNNSKEDVVGDSEATQLKIDYTPPEYITLIFTDIGILTPTAVSDELIKLA